MEESLQKYEFEDWMILENLSAVFKLSEHDRSSLGTILCLIYYDLTKLIGYALIGERIEFRFHFPANLCSQHNLSSLCKSITFLTLEHSIFYLALKSL